MKKSERTRQRIVEAANRLFYHKGYHNTSFTDVVQASGVPRGNIYYYFKKKEEILEAALKHRLQRIAEMLEEWNTHYRTPAERLERFLALLPENAETLLRYGCPMGTLNAELGKNDLHLQARARTMFLLFEDWLTDQFAELGYADRARELARRLLARGQGISMLTHVYRDRQLLEQETRLLVQWLQRLIQGQEVTAESL